MDQSKNHSQFLMKMLSIGAVFFICSGASHMVQSVVDDRLYYQTDAPAPQDIGQIDAQSSLVHATISGFTDDGVSVYRLVDRVLKYAILFIALTFLSFFLTEVVYKLRLHPMQYLLVGLGLAEFYLLFLACVEHMAFVWAYTIAAALTTLLITAYSRFVLHSRKSSLLVGLLLAIMYVYLFITLHLEFYALLAGAVLLFVALSVVMFLTRHLNWYDAFAYATTSERCSSQT